MTTFLLFAILAVLLTESALHQQSMDRIEERLKDLAAGDDVKLVFVDPFKGDDAEPWKRG